jgi:hypothetical protein
MSDDKTLKEFYSIFRGNTSFFIKHQYPLTEKKGKMTGSWCGYAVYNTYNPPPKGKEEGDLIPLTLDHYRDHLNGGDGLAISPLMNVVDSKGQIIKRNVCYFAVIDVDVYGVSFSVTIQHLYQAGLKFVPFLSKSGGLHIYFFFMEAEPGDKVIETLKRVVNTFGLHKLYASKDAKSKVEIFPKQATFVPGERKAKDTKNASCIFLPFYNIAHPDECRNKLLTIDRKKTGLVKATPIIDTMYTSLNELRSVLDNLPYNDAPFCIQMLLLSGALTENSGRNDFLFAAAVYLKKKQGDGFADELHEMNGQLEAPLDDEEVNDIYTSVTANGYEGFSCAKPPCSEYCDKKACALREYSPKRVKNNRFTGAECWGELTRYNAGSRKEPYFIWKVRIAEGEDFKEVQIDSHTDLLNQSTVQQNCLRDLNWVPFTIKQNDWVSTVLKCLVGIDERTIEVPASADTTEMAALRETFIQFLTHKQLQKNQKPYMVDYGQVCHKDGYYYFTTNGLVKYLRFEKHTLGRLNLREWLITQEECIENVELPYTTPAGKEGHIICWKKLETPELLAKEVFYEDVYEGEVDSITKNPQIKHVEEDEDGATKF